MFVGWAFLASRSCCLATSAMRSSSEALGGVARSFRSSATPAARTSRSAIARAFSLVRGALALFGPQRDDLGGVGSPSAGMRPGVVVARVRGRVMSGVCRAVASVCRAGAANAKLEP